MKMHFTPCFAKVCMMRSGSKSGTGRVPHLAEPGDGPTESPGTLFRREAVERNGLPHVGVVVRRQLDDQLEAAEPQQPLHRLQRRRGATRLEPCDGRLRRSGSVRERLLGDSRAPPPFSNELTADHLMSISLLLYHSYSMHAIPGRTP